jgi:hypothetical protein
MTTLQGLVEYVETLPARSFASADAAISDTVVYVADASQFYTDSGTCTVDIEGVEYDAVPTVDDAAEDYLTIDPPLSADVDELTPVTVVPASEVKWCHVSIANDEDQDLLKCRVPLALKGYTALDPGPRSGDEREAVTVETEPEPHVVDPPNQRTSFDGGVIDPETTIPPGALTDGEPPSGSPTPTLEAFAVGALRWSVTPVANADPVRFRIYADTVDPPTIDADHLIADSASLSGIFAAINGTRLLPDDPADPLPTYYVAAVEYDADGDGPTSATSNGVAPRRAGLSEISADFVYAGQIEASQIASGSILTGLLEVGSYIEINGEDSSITIYADPEHTRPLVQLHPDGSVFRGRVEADDISVLVGLILQGTDSHIAQSAGITLDASIKDPTVAPVLTSTIPTTQWDAAPSGYEVRGFCWDSANTQWLRLIFKASTRTVKVQKISVAGAVTATVTLADPGYTAKVVNCNSITVLGTNWYTCYRHGDDEAGYFWTVHKYTNTGTHTTGDGPGDWENNSDAWAPVVGTDGTNLLIAPASNTHDLGVMNTSLVVTAQWDVAGAGTFPGVAFAFLGKDNFDFGASRVVLEAQGTVYVYSLSGTTLTEDATKRFNTIGGDPSRGFGWDGTNFWSTRSVSTGNTYKYSNYYPAASEKAWVTYADTDTSSKKHTVDSPKASLALIARRHLSVSLPPAPVGAVTPRAYMGLATASPADTALLLRGETITSRALTIVPDAAGGIALVRTATVTNKALTSNVATLTTSAAHNLEPGDSITVAGVDATFNGTFTIVATPTTTTLTYAKAASNVSSTASSGTITNTDSNTFGSGTAAWLKSALGGLELYGDGVLKAPKLQVYSTKWARSSNQSLSDSTATDITLPDSPVGTTSTTYYSYSAGTVTIAVAGVYRVDGYVEFAAATTGYRRLAINLNGTRYTGAAVQPAGSGITRIAISATIACAAGDTLNLNGNQAQSTPANLNVAGAYMQVTRIGELAA